MPGRPRWRGAGRGVGQVGDRGPAQREVLAGQRGVADAELLVGHGQTAGDRDQVPEQPQRRHQVRRRGLADRTQRHLVAAGGRCRGDRTTCPGRVLDQSRRGNAERRRGWAGQRDRARDASDLVDRRVEQRAHVGPAGADGHRGDLIAVPDPEVGTSGGRDGKLGDQEWNPVAARAGFRWSTGWRWRTRAPRYSRSPGRCRSHYRRQNRSRRRGPGQSQGRRPSGSARCCPTRPGWM